MWNEKNFLDWYIKSGWGNLNQVSQETLSSVKATVDSELEFDFTEKILSFSRLKANYRDPPPKSNQAIDAYFFALDQLYKANPLIACKVIAVIVLLDNYSFDLLAMQKVIARLEQWLLDDRLTCIEKIEIGTQIWAYSGYGNKAHFKRDVLIPLLMPLYLEQSVTDAAFVAEKFNFISSQAGGAGDSRRYLFNSYIESPLDFLQFSRNVHTYIPRLLPEALLNCLNEAQHWNAQIARGELVADVITDETLRGIAKELYDIMPNTASPIRVCNTLIRHGFPDAAWFPKLTGFMWELVRDVKIENYDDVQNHISILMNAMPESSEYKETILKVKSWMIEFKLKNPEQNEQYFVKHATHLFESIGDALSEKYALTRNKRTPAPKDSEVINLLIEAYWQMVNWLEKLNLNAMLRVLLIGFRNNGDGGKMTDVAGIISQQAEKQFTTYFRTLMHQTPPEMAMELSKLVMSETRYSNYDKRLGKWLDEIYPEFWAVASTQAESVYRQALSHDSGHGRRWIYKNFKGM
jgi:hypothetical protein